MQLRSKYLRVSSLATTLLLVMVWAAPAAEAPQVTVLTSGAEGFAARIDTAGLDTALQETAAGEFLAVTWPGASIAGGIGEPGIPVMRRLFVAPVGAQVTIEVREGAAKVVDLDAQGLPWRVLSVQPPIEKVPGAVERAVFQYNEAAYTTPPAPSARASVEELGISRGQRLFLLEVRPVEYDPVARTLVYWPELDVEVTFSGGRAADFELSPLQGLSRIVLNPDQLSLAGTRGSGNYLIVVASAYETAISSFATAKAAQGFDVSTWVPTTSTTTAIKDHIQGLWGGPDAPDYILLVGDTNTIPTWTGGGEGSPSTDLPYACMDGSSDWYPDIAIGRFPVRSTGDVADIVDKTLDFENGVFADQDYLARAVFMASEDNYTVSEGTHNWVISNYMVPNGIASDKLYCHTYGATTSQTRNAFNNGRLFGIYSGHGGTYSWADGPAFSQSDVNGLTNNDMYAFVCSFACITGTFTATECFTETWILAPDKGSIAIYGSSVNSYWTEDDVLEKKVFVSLYDDGIREVSPCWQAALMHYLNDMGAGSTTRRYFEMYNLMGDPSLYLPIPGGGTGLAVTPSSDLASSGPAGGPFTPNSKAYTLENLNDTGINYTVSKGQVWVSLDDTGGYLAPHDTTTVTVSINGNADTLGNGAYSDTVSFVNTTDHDGDTTRSVDLTVGVPTVQYSWDMNTNPGWATEGLWAYGQPTGGGGQYGNPDPTSGHTGSNVYGYNLSGDYENSMPQRFLTTAAIDCSNLSSVSFKFWRWLGVETSSYDHAYLHVSNTGSTWVELWANTDYVEENSWSQHEFDISTVADGESTVYLRWTMGTTDSSWQYCGWNLDDVEIWAIAISEETCDDGILNQGEDKIDCGGPCPACNCLVDGDCLFCNGETCDAYGECQPGDYPCEPEEWCDEENDVCVSLPPCAVEDVNCDGTTDSLDLGVVKNPANWLLAVASAAEPRTDVNGDGLVDSLDLGAIKNPTYWLSSTGDCQCPE